MNRREDALSIHAGQPKPLPPKTIASSPFVPVLIQPLNAMSAERFVGGPRIAHTWDSTDAHARAGCIVRESAVQDHAAFAFFACSTSAAQMNPESSRATAMLALFTALPRSTSRR